MCKNLPKIIYRVDRLLSVDDRCAIVSLSIVYIVGNRSYALDIKLSVMRLDISMMCPPPSSSTCKNKPKPNALLASASDSASLRGFCIQAQKKGSGFVLLNMVLINNWTILHPIFCPLFKYWFISSDYVASTKRSHLLFNVMLFKFCISLMAALS